MTPLDANQESTVDHITFLLLNQILTGKDAEFSGFLRIKEQIRFYVTQQQPIELLLPAFPCKSINLDKVLGKLPDMGEFLAFKRFVQCIRDIEAVYSPGAKLTIFSDYHTFSDYIQVDLNNHYAYSEKLHTIVEHFHASDVINIQNFHHFQEFSDYAEYDYMQALKSLYGDPEFEENFSKLTQTNEDIWQTYLGLRGFMGNDQAHLLKDKTRSEQKSHLSYIAKGMMVQGRALDNFLNHHFPTHIRLSIHNHPMVGQKYAVYLFDTPDFITPWHCTVLFDATASSFRYEAYLQHHLKSDKDEKVLLKVNYQDQPWLLIAMQSQNVFIQKQLPALKMSLERPQSGLIIDAADTSLCIQDLDKAQLTSLIKHFGAVVLRNFKPFETPNMLEEWYATRGDLIPWKFGYTHIVAPIEGHQGKPVSSVDSEEALPIHWDLLCPPNYMEITQDKYAYKDFIPREFMLYCHQIKAEDPKTQGLSILLDSINIPLTIHGQEREQLKRTTLAYRTKQTYFGGASKQFPLVMQCPWTEQTVMRWWEAWTEDDHPGTRQPNYSNIVASEHYDDMLELEKRLREICLTPANQFHLQLQAGDALIINNHTMLHGRTAFKGYRELWRIQMQPPSKNSPFKQFSFMKGQLMKNEAPVK
ncbi:L-tyrosine/L-tryptophan isonitrile synthase family protein [Algicola sagamiensis]|uniref:L-tyrosine/L-tryptophan isonitrile synthase family protein n=1 Tax=Algicola sagamiensis TaxID=163869 RepID=UPI00037EB7DF|nr:L-tyrosine/L-tryptophan isonitrile synthase family protein [Algicola sagamiensis]